MYRLAMLKENAKERDIFGSVKRLLINIFCCTMEESKLNRFWFHFCQFNVCIVDLYPLDFVYWSPKKSLWHSDPLTRFRKR